MSLKQDEGLAEAYRTAWLPGGLKNPQQGAAADSGLNL